MAKHHPAHARSGFGRYTAPRRLHPAHAAPSADGVRLARTAGAVIGAGVLASVGLMGLATSPSDAASLGPSTSPPFSSLGTFVTDPDGSVAGIAGGGGTLADPAEADAEAGTGASANLDSNTAFSGAFGPGAQASSLAGDGVDANVSGNKATSTAFGATITSAAPHALAESEAGTGVDANASSNTATAWSIGGVAGAAAGLGTDAQAADNLAWAGSQFSAVDAVAGQVEDAGGSGNSAYAYGLFATSVGAFAGIGTDGAYNDNLAIAQSTLGRALACAGTSTFAVGGTSVQTCGVAAGITTNTGDTLIIAGPGSNDMASAGSVAGVAEAFAEGGDNNSAAASAVGGGIDYATADGTDNTAAALGVAGGSATASAVGTGEDADATAVGGGSTATAGYGTGPSSVGATSGLGGWSAASTSGGIWTVSINGATLVS
ncbi:MAG TPA: hypothetical protein VN781_03320 [Acidimicrobiales bacterium]|nr:hypothetical protein [Acidimicrobiales bacterium]